MSLFISLQPLRFNPWSKAKRRNTTWLPQDSYKIARAQHLTWCSYGIPVHRHRVHLGERKSIVGCLEGE